MPIFVTVLGTFILVIVGRITFGHIFNHVSLYAAVWGGALTLFEMQLINYYPLDSETWAIIYSGSICFFLGSLTVWAYHLSINPEHDPRLFHPPVVNLTSPQFLDALRKVLWILNGLTFAIVLQHWYAMAKIAGGFAQVFIFSNVLYSFRVEWGIPGGIPYIKCLALLGALLGGVLTSLTGRAKFVAVAPLLIILIGEIVSAGRSLLIQGGIFFLCGYFPTRFHVTGRIIKKRTEGRFRRLVALVAVFAVVAVGIEFVRSNRGGEVVYAGYTSKLSSFRGSMFITPSIYLYVTSNFGILNQYLKHDNEHVPWGGNTFGPVYHLLEKFGSTIHVGLYQRFYMTPPSTNLGTYLREVHEDFGIAGIFLYPYLLGLIASLAWFSLCRRFRFGVLVLMGALFDIIVMALFVITTRGGDLFVVIIVGLVVGSYLDRQATKVPADSIPQLLTTT